jgi:hypothetical protein
MDLSHNTIRNHGLFDWKTKPKTSKFDIWLIWPLSHIGQVDLNTSNLIIGFFDHEMVFLTTQIRQKIKYAKQLIKKN